MSPSSLWATRSRTRARSPPMLPAAQAGGTAAARALSRTDRKKQLPSGRASTRWKARPPARTTSAGPAAGAAETGPNSVRSSAGDSGRLGTGDRSGLRRTSSAVSSGPRPSWDRGSGSSDSPQATFADWA